MRIKLIGSLIDEQNSSSEDTTVANTFTDDSGSEDEDFSTAERGMKVEQLEALKKTYVKILDYYKM